MQIMFFSEYFFSQNITIIRLTISEVCTPGICNNGDCVPNPDGTHTCACLLGWSGAACDTGNNAALLILLVPIYVSF